ncbi:hypothetical protein HRH59_09190 [Rheinheimera sp. YQF-2]|uniref:Uncharacterized protein n=1 Tax=Rheinheimera lutimaris TaxID=2740584 RepID=A0A7Y5EIV5_9GAMM|nr:hypothetical protein [Rheinheimera lutimaris]NRQ42736.1 hypothetical protein [Rheinheimera lutimaris]
MTIRSMFQIVSAVMLLIAFLSTGLYILYISEISASPLPNPLSGWPKVIFGIFLMTCMVMGMVANYLWDLFNAGKSWLDITWRGIALPILVSPIVFFTVWSMWKGDPISFGLPLFAFQNGFFWQVIFSKAGPRSA